MTQVDAQEWQPGPAPYPVAASPVPAPVVPGPVVSGPPAPAPALTAPLVAAAVPAPALAAPVVAAPGLPSPAPVGGLRWRPWLGRPRAADLLCFAGIVVSVVYGLAMIPLTPELIATHPVLLEALSGSTSSIVAAGAFADVENKLQLTVVVAAALPGLMKFDVLYWWAGARWGHRAVERLGHRSSRAAAIVRRTGQRGTRFAGPLVLVSAFVPGIPAPLAYAVAGFAGLRLLPFVLFDLIGSLAWAAVLAWLGLELGPSGIAAADLISRYALAATALLLVLAVAPQAWHVLRGRRGRAAGG